MRARAYTLQYAGILQQPCSECQSGLTASAAEARLDPVKLKTLWLFFLYAALSGPLLSAEKKVITPPEFGGAMGVDRLPFSPGILVDGTLYISGQMGSDRKTGTYPADFDAEVRNCLEYIGLVLKAADMSYSDVVSVQVFLTDMKLFAQMNAVYASVFKAPRPARATVGVSALASPNGRIEISAVARKANP
jgi:2-iminobutanoate/2-iminopropanoate deaminase